MPTVWPPGQEPDEVPEPIPAATVVVLRDGPEGLETLLLRRNAALEFAGGMWVFPGGRVDEADRSAADDELATAGADGRTGSHAGGDDRTSGHAGGDGAAAAAPDDECAIAAARHAAVREAAEEAALELAPSSLVWFSHWTPPPVSIKRYATWFFAAPAPEPTRRITIDGGEIHDHGWTRPADALARRNAGEIELAPPTWITLEHLARFADVDDALATLRATPAERFETRFAPVEGGAVALYHGDVAYDDLDPEPSRPGGRHRLWMVASGWRYERDGWG